MVVQYTMNLWNDVFYKETKMKCLAYLGFLARSFSSPARSPCMSLNISSSSSPSTAGSIRLQEISSSIIIELPLHAPGSNLGHIGVLVSVHSHHPSLPPTGGQAS